MHYKETMSELTEICPNQDVINDIKLTENWQIFVTLDKLLSIRTLFCQLSVIYCVLIRTCLRLDSDMFLSIRALLFPCSGVCVCRAADQRAANTLKLLIEETEEPLGHCEEYHGDVGCMCPLSRNGRRVLEIHEHLGAMIPKAFFQASQVCQRSNSVSFYSYVCIYTCEHWSCMPLAGVDMHFYHPIATYGWPLCSGRTAIICR